MLRFYFVLLLGTLCIPNPVQAGPWPQPRGKGYFKLSEWWIRFDEHYTSNGELDPNATLGLYNTTFYGEYGITDRLTAVANLVPYSRATINNQVSATRSGLLLIPGGAINGIGDSDLGVRYALTKSGADFPVAVSLTLGLPLGEDAGGEGGQLQTGDGEFNQLLQLSIGHSFKLAESISAYAIAEVGVNNRSNNFSDEFRYGVEAGIGLAQNRLFMIGRVRGSESFFNGGTNEGTTSIFSNNAEYLSIGGEVNYYLTRRAGVSAGVAGAVSGRIIAAAPAFTVGVFVDTSR